MQDWTFDAVEYLPAAQWAHELAPAVDPVFVIEPAAHLLQSAALLEPVVPMYVPASQSVQAATFDAVEYLPTAHSVHVVAPVPVPVLVIEPAAQSVHDVAMFELIEYLPAMHAVHVFAPALVPLSVIDPAAHSEQYDLPPSD